MLHCTCANVLIVNVARLVHIYSVVLVTSHSHAGCLANPFLSPKKLGKPLDMIQVLIASIYLGMYESSHNLSCSKSA